MKRKTFLQSLGIYSGLAIGAPGALVKGNSLHKNNRSDQNHYSRSRRTWNGFKPEVLKAPWGQSVIYDRYSYIDLHNYKL